MSVKIFGDSRLSQAEMKLGQPRRQDQCQQICSTFIVEGTRVEQMKDGEKRKLTPPNPMRNVGLAVNIFFIQCHINHRCLFNFSLRFCWDIWRYYILRTKCVVSVSFCPAAEMLSWKEIQWLTMTMRGQNFQHLYHILIQRSPWQRELLLRLYQIISATKIFVQPKRLKLNSRIYNMPLPFSNDTNMPALI